MSNPFISPRQPLFPLVTLLNPRQQWGFLLFMLALSLGLSWLGVQQYGWPLWVAAALVLAFLLVPLALKWWDDWHRYGEIGMGLSFLLIAQGFHTVEHLAQWVQYHLLDWQMRDASGLLSPANSEWVHFIWNWLVVAVVLWLVGRGWRNPWAWGLAIWSLAHATEHTYMFVRYWQVLNRLEEMGITTVTAQGLPGLLGRGGWLAQSELTSNTFLCRLPGFTTAVRLDIHFWWNAGELLLLLAAAHQYLRHAWVGKSVNGKQLSVNSYQ